MDSAKVTRIIDRGQKLHKLHNTDGWNELRLMVAAREEKFSRNLAARLLSGTPVDQREIDRFAGFFAGCKWLLDSVDHAEETLERALQKAQDMKGSDA